MRSTTLILMYFAFTVPKLLAYKGNKYTKENVCQEKFREIVTVLYSQKFPNGTFDEVTCVVDEMTKLAEKCCKDEANPDCYDKGATEISEKSCGKDSPLPKHPGMEQCCAHQGQARKHCLASLRYSVDELPSLLEPSNQEICARFATQGKDYAVRYIYEFARRHRNIPAGIVLNATQNHVQMAERCCHAAVRDACFLQEKLQLKSFKRFLRFLSNACNNQVQLKDYGAGLSAHYGNLLGLSFEEASSMSSRFQSGLAKCCLQPQPECIIEELTNFQKALCSVSTPRAASEELHNCCGKPALDTLPCVEDLKRQARSSPHLASPGSSQMCKEAQPDGIGRYLFQVGITHASVPLPVLTTVLNEKNRTLSACCSSDDVTACLTSEESKLKNAATLLTKIEETCSQYSGLELYASHTMIQVLEAERRAQAWVDMAASCCFNNSPAPLCQKLTEEIIQHERDADA